MTIGKRRDPYLSRRQQKKAKEDRNVYTKGYQRAKKVKEAAVKHKLDLQQLPHDAALLESYMNRNRERIAEQVAQEIQEQEAKQQKKILKEQRRAMPPPEQPASEPESSDDESDDEPVLNIRKKVPKIQKKQVYATASAPKTPKVAGRRVLIRGRRK